MLCGFPPKQRSLFSPSQHNHLPLQMQGQIFEKVKQKKPRKEQMFSLHMGKDNRKRRAGPWEETRSGRRMRWKPFELGACSTNSAACNPPLYGCRREHGSSNTASKEGGVWRGLMDHLLSFFQHCCSQELSRVSARWALSISLCFCGLVPWGVPEILAEEMGTMPWSKIHRSLTKPFLLRSDTVRGSPLKTLKGKLSTTPFDKEEPV